LLNPLPGRVCTTPSGRVINYRKTWITFTLASADTVDAYIFNTAGRLVNTVKTRVRMAANARSPRFYWGGKQANAPHAPDGTYYWRFVLEHASRHIALTDTPIK